MEKSVLAERSAPGSTTAVSLAATGTKLFAVSFQTLPIFFDIDDLFGHRIEFRFVIFRFFFNHFQSSLQVFDGLVQFVHPCLFDVVITFENAFFLRKVAEFRVHLFQLETDLFNFFFVDDLGSEIPGL